MNSYTHQSETNWKKVLLLWAIHGNEVCGPQALQSLHRDFGQWIINIEQWLVTIVPICNPKAYVNNVRFIDHDLWRIFMDSWTWYEFELVPEIKKLIDQHDIILDLHSMQSKWVPFWFMDYPTPEAKQVVKYLGIKSILCGRPNIYTDTTQWDLHKYAHQQWKISFCIECWSHNDKEAEAVGYSTCINLLRHLCSTDTSMINNTIDSTKLITMKELFKKEKEWSLMKERLHWQTIWAWKCIAIYEDWSILSSPYNFDTIMILPKKDPTIWWERFYLWVDTV